MTRPFLERFISGRTSGGMLAWLVAGTAWLTWSPFVRRSEPPVLHLGVPGDPLDIVGNLVLLIPVTVTVALIGARGRTGHRAMGPPLTAAVVLAVVLESGQLLVAGRMVTPWDIALNLAGATPAAWAAVRVSRRAVRRAVLLTLWTVGYAAVLAALAGSATVASQRFRLAGWDPSLAFAVGEEPGAARAFTGQVEDARLCAGEGPELCVSTDPDDEGRRRLVAWAEGAQRVRVEARVLPPGDAQGPERIVTFSRGADLRNVTLGQEGRSLLLRLRTPLTGPNGSRPEFRLDGVMTPGAIVRVAGGFRDGAAFLRVSGEGRETSAVFRPGPLDAWLFLVARDHLAPRHLFRARLVGALVLLLPVGLLAGAAGRPLPGLLTAAGASVAIVLALGACAGAAPAGLEIAAALAVAGAGWLLATTPGSFPGRRPDGDGTATAGEGRDQGAVAAKRRSTPP